MRHFLQETDFSRDEVAQIFALARRFKQERGHHEKPLAGQTWAMIFAKSSTRTRVSFEVGIHELGGNPLFLNTNDIQIGRGEPISDTAKVLGRFVHGLVVRTYAHADVVGLAQHGGRPVVNALTDFLHPCQIYTDAFTAAERWAGPDGDLFASLRGRKVAFLGDTCFNMANSWILGANLFGMKVSLGGAGDRRSRQGNPRPRGQEWRHLPFHLRPLRGSRRGRHRLYGCVGQHGAGERISGAAAAHAAIPGKQEAFRSRQARCALHALSAGACRRGSDTRGARSPAQRDFR